MGIIFNYGIYTQSLAAAPACFPLSWMMRPTMSAPGATATSLSWAAGPGAQHKVNTNIETRSNPPTRHRTSSHSLKRQRNNWIFWFAVNESGYHISKPYGTFITCNNSCQTTRLTCSAAPPGAEKDIRKHCVETRPLTGELVAEWCETRGLDGIIQHVNCSFHSDDSIAAQGKKKSLFNFWNYENFKCFQMVIDLIQE